MKFETARIDECIDFIEAKGLHRVSGAAASGGDAPDGKVRVVATGGGAYKYADIFQARTARSCKFMWVIPENDQKSTCECLLLHGTVACGRLGILCLHPSSVCIPLGAIRY